jgi:hypothetical protein
MSGSSNTPRRDGSGHIPSTHPATTARRHSLPLAAWAVVIVTESSGPSRRTEPGANSAEARVSMKSTSRASFPRRFRRSAAGRRRASSASRGGDRPPRRRGARTTPSWCHSSQNASWGWSAPRPSTGLSRRVHRGLAPSRRRRRARSSKAASEQRAWSGLPASRAARRTCTSSPVVSPPSSEVSSEAHSSSCPGRRQATVNRSRIGRTTGSSLSWTDSPSTLCGTPSRLSSRRRGGSNVWKSRTMTAMSSHATPFELASRNRPTMPIASSVTCE